MRIRIGNLTMTNHPIHIHGHEFEVTGTDGGWVPKSARWPEVTTDVAVGQMRAIEFDANAPGDWSFHCHKAHHTMNAMGHQVPTMIGVDQREAAEKINRLVPEYMAMGAAGMAEHAEHTAMGHMAMPNNTLPMMSGTGQYGGIEMGGMFTVVKIREGLAKNVYTDPGWYKHPKGTVAYAWNGEMPKAAEAPAAQVTEGDMEMTVRKPTGHGGH